MIKYVVGFLFDKLLKLVVLIEKQTPEWQRNKWNGVGGKIEPGETPLQAMSREFEEEAGLIIYDWKQFCTLHEENFEIYMFYSMAESEYLMNVQTKTKEKVSVLLLEHIEDLSLLPNIKWIIPMALMMIKENHFETYKILVKYGTQ